MYFRRLHTIHNCSVPVLDNITAIVDIFIEVREFAADVGTCLVDAAEWLAILWAAKEVAVAI